MEIYKIAIKTKGDDFYHSRADTAKGRKFRHLYEGGNNKAEI